MRIDEWTKEELKYLSENYLTKTYTEIGKVLGRTRVAVMVKANRTGIKLPQKIFFNTDFFRTIDTEKKAYWLGFLYADGYISGEYEMSISLKRSDVSHLKKLNKDMEGVNVQIKEYDKFLAVTQKYYEMCSIRFYSKKNVENLLRHGLYPDKSLTIEFPKIRKDLVRHFIRGFFDGDGCLDSYVDIRNSKTKERLRAKFTSASPLFLNELVKILSKNGIRTHYTKNHEGNKSVNLCIGGFGSLRRFLKYIYEDSSIYLDRKNKFYKTHKYLLDLVEDREE